MNTSSKTQTIARPVSTPQRKARYHDKTRLRLKVLKTRVLEYLDIRDTKEIKSVLKEMGYKLDLRLTSAWEAIWFEILLDIKDFLKPQIKVGDRVFWKKAPAYFESWGALEVVDVQGEMVELDLLVHLVSSDELAIA